MNAAERLTVWLDHGERSYGRTLPTADIREVVRLASVDTHPKGGDAQQAPSLMGSAVGNAETPQSPPLSQGDE